MTTFRTLCKRIALDIPISRLLLYDKKERLALDTTELIVPRSEYITADIRGLVGINQLSNKMKKLFIITSLLLGSIATFAQRDMGYRGFADLYGGIGVTPASNFIIGLSTVHGYQAAPFLFVGAGVAVHDIAYKEGDKWGEIGNDGLLIPFFADVRFDFGEGKVWPFVELRGGYDFICGNGFYLSPSAGCHIALTDKFGFNLSLGFDYQKTKEPFYRDGKLNKGLGYLTLKFGIDF